MARAERRLRAAFIANGGSEEEFDANKDTLRTEHLQEETLKAPNADRNAVRRAVRRKVL